MKVATKYNLLGESVTKGYRPSTLIFPLWYWAGQSMFTLQDVEAMRKDYQITLGLNMIKAPFYTVEWAIDGKNQIINKFIDDELKRFWKPSITKILRSLEYGYTGGEILYKLNKQGQVVFKAYKEFHPRDIRCLTLGYEYLGLRVKNIPTRGDVDLYPPKGFWYAVDREFGGWYGRSWLLNCWEPWYEKRSRDGAIDIRRLWFYKNAFTGGIIRHPNKDYVMPDGSIYSAREMAREMGERMKTGAPIIFPSTKDLEGNYVWTHEPARMTGDAEEIRSYPRDLDVEILRGLRIPDSILTDQPGAGSYSSRRVPERAFYVGLEAVLADLMHAVKLQFLDRVIEMNFDEEDYEYKIITKPLVQVASPEGSPPAGYGQMQGDTGDSIGGLNIGSTGDANDGEPIPRGMQGAGASSISLRNTHFRPRRIGGGIGWYA